jgi:hypothetical protein
MKISDILRMSGIFQNNTFDGVFDEYYCGFSSKPPKINLSEVSTPWVIPFSK